MRKDNWISAGFLIVSLVQVLTQQCKSPSNTDGVCINFDDCKSLKSLSHDHKNIRYIKKSKCEKDPASSLVCCPDGKLTTTPAPTFNLLSPPNCGIYPDDRIFGGNVTNIDEHPCTALLFYNIIGMNFTYKFVN